MHLCRVDSLYFTYKRTSGVFQLHYTRTTLPHHHNPVGYSGLGFEGRLLRQLFLASKSLCFLRIVGESANPLQMICK